MFLESFQVNGFKSLRDVRLDALDDVNVFHGNNNVGKSNILQAIDVFFQLLPIAAQSVEDAQDERLLTLADLAPYTDSIFRMGDETKVDWKVRVRLSTGVYDFGLRLRLRSDTASRRNGTTLALQWLDLPFDLPIEELRSPNCDFNLISAARRVADEWLSDADRPVELTSTLRHGSPVEPENLKRTLFDSVYAANLTRRKSFQQLQSFLDNILGVGQLDVVVNPPRPLQRLSLDARESYVRDILLRFLPSGVSLADMGSGVQQTVLTLGQVMFNPARLVGLEEPEMNLGPDWQMRLATLLHALAGPEKSVDQIFITSHSPAFEDEPFFYDVTYSNGETLVAKLPLGDRRKYFAEAAAEISGEELGPYLNSHGQITLPQRVIEDLNLTRRQPVFFFKEADGRWVLRNKQDLLDLMKAEDQADDDTTENRA